MGRRSASQRRSFTFALHASGEPESMGGMNPRYLGMTEALEFLTLIVVGPALAVVIAYKAWRDKSPNPKKSGLQCVISGAVALLLLAYVQGRGVDVRSAQYFVQLACSLLSFLLIGVFMGCGFAVLLGVWRWHNTTRLKPPA